MCMYVCVVCSMNAFTHACTRALPHVCVPVWRTEFNDRNVPQLCFPQGDPPVSHSCISLWMLTTTLPFSMRTGYLNYSPHAYRADMILSYLPASEGVLVLIFQSCPCFHFFQTFALFFKFSFNKLSSIEQCFIPILFIVITHPII